MGVLWLVCHDILAQPNQSSSDEIDRLLAVSESYTYNIPDSSILIAQEAYRLSTENNDINRRIISGYAIGRAYYVKGEFSTANQYYASGLDEAIAIGNEVLICQGYNNVGLILASQKEFDQAVILYRKGLELAGKISDTTMMIKIGFNASIAYDDVANLQDSALAYLDPVIRLAEKVGNTHMMAMSYNRKGVILSKVGKYDHAIALHEKALANMASDNDWERCYAYAGLSQAYARQGQFEKAIDFGENSLKIAQKLGAIWEIQRAASILSEVYATQHKFEQAFEYHQLYKSYSDSVFSLEKEQELNALHLERVQMENRTLQRENELRQEDAKLSRLIILISALLLVTSLIVGYLLHRRAEQRRKLSLELLEKNHQIEEQKKKLESLIMTKDKMLSIIAHDMRSPMNVLMGLIYQVKQVISDNPELDKIALSAHNQALNIKEILENLLVWAQDQYQGEKMVPRPVNVTEIVDQVEELYRFQIEQKSLAFNSSREPLAIARVDKNHLHFIIRNLIGNAIKFTPERGKIEINYEISDEYVTIQIADNGIGMSKDQRAGLFDDQMHSTLGTNGEKGSGLGLMLCREYAEINNGQLSIESTLNTGTTVSLTLPRASRVSI